jgi:hypothetical protein
MLSEEEFLERAAKVVKLSYKMRDAASKGKVNSDQVRQYELLIEGKLNELKRFELDAFDHKMSELIVSRQDLDVKRTAQILSEEVYLSLVESLEKHADTLEADRKKLHEMSGPDYMALLHKRVKAYEEADPERLAVQERRRMLESFYMIIQSIRFDEGSLLTTLVILAIVGLKYGIYAKAFTPEEIPFMTHVLALAGYVVSLYAATVLARVKRADSKSTLVTVSSIYIFLMLIDLAIQEGPFSLAIIFFARIGVTFVIIRNVFALESPEAIIVTAANYILFMIILLVLGVPPTYAIMG